MEIVSGISRKLCALVQYLTWREKRINCVFTVKIFFPLGLEVNSIHQHQHGRIVDSTLATEFLDFTLKKKKVSKEYPKYEL